MLTWETVDSFLSDSDGSEISQVENTVLQDLEQRATDAQKDVAGSWDSGQPVSSGQWAAVGGG